MRAGAKPEAGRGAQRRRGRGRLRDLGDYTPRERLCPRAAMLWFQGAIPAAIALAKRSGAVFVVFVAGEGGEGARRGRDTPSGLLLIPGAPSFSSGRREARAARLPGVSAPPPSVWSAPGLAPHRPLLPVPGGRHGPGFAPEARRAPRSPHCAGRGDGWSRPSPLSPQRPAEPDPARTLTPSPPPGPPG